MKSAHTHSQEAQEKRDADAKKRLSKSLRKKAVHASLVQDPEDLVSAERFSAKIEMKHKLPSGPRTSARSRQTAREEEEEVSQEFEVREQVSRGNKCRGVRRKKVVGCDTSICICSARPVRSRSAISFVFLSGRSTLLQG